MAIGAGAFCAGELVFRVAKKEFPNAKLSVYEVLKDAKAKNDQIARLIPQIEDADLIKMLKEIKETVGKIITTVEKKPEKYKNMTNFFNYYLPVTINIIHRYDEIENQKLSSAESKKFMESTKSMIAKINEAFKKQLSNLYQSDMIDTDAEMKVFESMLQADGYNQENDFKVKKEGDE